jgi:radical SAM superfamily enzyme YgiQ (UPF0313 family)
VGEQVSLTLERGRRRRTIDATRVHFSAHQCFPMDGRSDEALCARRLGQHLLSTPGLALYGPGRFLDLLLQHTPELKTKVEAVIADGADGGASTDGLPVVAVDAVPVSIRTVFLCETRAFQRQQMRKRLPPGVGVLDADCLVEIALDAIPARAWTPIIKHIYPLNLPEVRFEAGLDAILIDCPARNLALMPNGLGYVHNVLSKLPVKFQTFDLDVVTYHRYHMRRLFDEGGSIVLPNGREMPTDPWQAEHYDLWADPAVIDYFMPIIDEAAAAIIAARPKILGLSIQQCSEAFSRALVNRVKAALPDTVVMVGGFSCYNGEIGLKAFPEADYMCIGEADLTVGPLVRALARGERPRNQPGILSKYDTPDYEYLPGPMPHNLDQLDFPRYQWFDLGIYRNYNGYQLVPIIASRGCRWSRCTFCAERFYWRIHSAKVFVDELEWLVEQGCTLFMFNESDLNGMPEKVLEICDEIIDRGLKIKLTGQLRIHKKSDRAYFQKLRQAGFVALRFGVDAFSENTLRLQKKGYTTEMVSQNLRDCWESGIYTEVNWVIGVPGETDADCTEGIELILANRQYIGRLANINPLILSSGSVYWLDPDAHNIKFRGEKDELYAKYPRAIPADYWYSTEPYIDAQVRKKWFERIVLALHDAQFPVGAWASRIIEDVRLARDRARAGSAPDPAAAGDETQPRLVRSLATHNIFRLKGAYFALPHALGEVDLVQVDPETLPGVIKDSSEAALMVALEHASAFSNARGHYDARARQKQAGTYFRAGSNMSEAEERVEVEIAKPEILSYRGELFAVDHDQLDKAFRWFPGSDAAEGEAEAARAAAQISGTPLRRMARALPAPITAELRRLWRARQFEPAVQQVGRASDLAIVKIVAKGILDEYVRAPVDRLLKSRAPATPRHRPVPGRDFAVVGSVTKGATPDLLTVVDNYNIVQFDSRFYGCPHGTVIDWADGRAAELPGVIVADTAQEVMARIRTVRGRPLDAAPRARAGGSGPAGEISIVPRQLGSLEGYNIVTYEGWVFGIPQEHGEVDLAETDAMELSGVIRDVSRDVVESEILERRQHERSTVAAE